MHGRECPRLGLMADPIYRRAGSVMEAEIGGELVTLDPNADDCFAFTPVARTVWRSLEQPKSFVQLRDELLAEYDVGSEQCAAELRQLLDELIRQGLIEKHSEPRRKSQARTKTSEFKADDPEPQSVPKVALSG